MKKKFLLYGLLILASSAIIYSCKKSADEGSELKQNSDNLRKLTAEFGKLHNKGLDFISAKQGERSTRVFVGGDPGGGTGGGGNDTTIATILYYDAANYMTDLAMSNSATYAGDPSVIARLDNVIYTADGDLVRSEYGSSLGAAGGALTTRESNMIAEITAIFDYAYTQNYNQAQTYSYLNTQLTALKNTYSSTAFNPTEGELFNGLIDIALNSNEYWSDPNIVFPLAMKKGNGKQTKVAIVPNPAFIQMDCIGYIIGWVSEVQSDIAANNLHESGQKRRISKGFYNALGWSAGAKFLKK